MTDKLIQPILFDLNHNKITDSIIGSDYTLLINNKSWRDTLTVRQSLLSLFKNDCAMISSIFALLELLKRKQLHKKFENCSENRSLRILL
jgi:hypothetical protein